MFSLFKKKKVASYIFSDDLARKAICSNALFKTPSLFLYMKLTDENRDEFLENNFFNLRYSGGTEGESTKTQVANAIKEALQVGYDIVDKVSYEDSFNSFVEGGLTHAWDIVRMVGVTQDAYTVGYIDLTLGQENITYLGGKISENYTSWEALITDFILGKLEFNELKELEGEDIKKFSSIENILVMIDLLFNDKDTPLKKALFNKDEKLVQSEKNILEPIISVSQRARNMMKVYRKVYGWEPFVLIERNVDNERDKNTYLFIKEKLELQPLEEIVFIHAYTHKKPEKSEIQLILTNQHIISFSTKEKRYIYISLEEIHESSLAIRGYEKELFINDHKMLDGFCINSEREILPYLEIIYDIVVFVRNREEKTW